jgi:hypothetical protein
LHPLRAVIIAPLAAVSIVAMLAASLVAQEWRNAVAGPELALLGSGSRLSALIRAGETRVLIAAGDNIDEFDRAYARVQRPTAPRIDLLIVAGTGRHFLVPERLVARDAARQVLTLHAIGADARGGVLTDEQIPTIRQRREIRIDNDVMIAINPVSDYLSAQTWAITVMHRGMRILIVPNADALQSADRSRSVSSLVVLGKMDFRTPHRESRSIIVHGDQAQAAIQASTDDPTTSGPWLWTVHDSEALVMAFKEGALLIPPSGARRLLAWSAAVPVDIASCSVHARPILPPACSSGR